MSRTDKLREHATVLEAYLDVCIDRREWFAVVDAAMSIAGLEAELRGLGHAGNDDTTVSHPLYSTVVAAVSDALRDQPR